MNSVEIDHILRNDAVGRQMFCGVFALDTLPLCKTGGYVCNTAPKSHPGTHWEALFRIGDQVDYLILTVEIRHVRFVMYLGENKSLTTPSVYKVPFLPYVDNTAFTFCYRAWEVKVCVISLVGSMLEIWIITIKWSMISYVTITLWMSVW